MARIHTSQFPRNDITPLVHMHRRCVLAAWCMLLLAALTGLASAGWLTTTVDSEGDVGWHTSLAFNATGCPAISYFDYTDGDLKFAFQDGNGVWHNTTVDSGGYVGYYSSLAFNATGPAISYRDGIGEALKFAFQDGNGVWHTTTVDSGGGVGMDTSLAFNATGPAISYYDNTDGDLKFAFQDGSGVWHTTIVDSEGDVGDYTSLAFNATGCPAISYYENTLGDLKFAFQDGSGVWHNTTVDSGSGGYAGAYSSLAFNATGCPAISYYDSYNMNLKFAFQDGSGVWHTTTVDNGVYVGTHTSLAFNATGPAISYRDGWNDDLKFAFQDGNGVWHTTTVDSEGEIGYDTSLAFDATGPAISYYENTLGDLKFAWWVPPPDVTLITPDHGVTGTVGLITTLAGANFYGTPVVTLRNGSETITATGVIVDSPRKITCTFDLPAGSAPGQWDIVVTNPHGESGMLPGGFRVMQQTSTTVYSSLNPAYCGDTVTFTAYVTGSEGIPGETVTFMVNGNTWPGSSGIQLNSTGAANVTTTSLSGGWHNITAWYNGNASMAPSMGSLDPQVVFSLDTTPITVTSSKNPSLFGEAVTFSAHVTGIPKNSTAISPVLAGAGYVPIHHVQFRADGVDLGSPVPLDPSGTANVTTTGLAFGIHAITVEYGGNASWRPGTGTLPGGQMVSASTAVFRSSEPDNWIFTNDLATAIHWDHYGTSSDIPLFGDFNGDGRMDRAVFRGGQWIVDHSLDGTVNSRSYYGMQGDVPLVGDFNQDGVMDRAIFRGSAANNWIFDYSFTGVPGFRDHYGLPTDIPLVADMNHDRVTDRAVFRNGVWIFDYGMDGTVDARDIFGLSGDIPLAGDVNLDGVTDRVVVRNGEWIVDYGFDGVVDLRSRFGTTGDKPLIWPEI